MSAILITGVNGFAGSHLAADLIQRGHRVIGSTSRAARSAAATPGTERRIVLPLDQPCDPAVFLDVAALVHCAWDLRPGMGPTNMAGTSRIAETGARAGVNHQIFLSSYSAHPAAVSEYGRTKFAVQEYFLRKGHAVARLGLVVGPGGMFQRMHDTLKACAAVPLVDGGRARVPVVDIVDAVAALGLILERRATGLFNLFHPDLVTLKQLTATIRSAAGSRCLLVPVPASLLLTPLRLLARAGIRLPVDPDSLRSLRANQHVADPSNLPDLVPCPRPLVEMVARAHWALAARASAGVIPSAGRDA